MLPANAFEYRAISQIECGKVWCYREDWWFQVTIFGAVEGETYAVQLKGQNVGLLRPFRGGRQQPDALTLASPYTWLPVVESTDGLRATGVVTGTVGLGPAGCNVWGAFEEDTYYAFDLNGIDVTDNTRATNPRFADWKAVLVHKDRPDVHLGVLFEVNRTGLAG